VRFLFYRVLTGKDRAEDPQDRVLDLETDKLIGELPSTRTARAAPAAEAEPVPSRKEAELEILGW